MKRKEILRHIGNVLMILAIIFIVVKLYQYREAFYKSFNWSIGGVMLVFAVITAAFIVLASLLYGKLVQIIANKQVPMKTVVPVYCKSNLYKYIPGNVLQYVGRNQIAELSNARHEQVALASLLEMGLTAAGALIVAFFFSREFVLEWFASHNSVPLICAVALAIIALAAVFVLLKKKDNKRLSELRSVITRRNVLFLLFYLLFIVVNQIANGAMFLVLLHQLTGELPRIYWMNIIGIYCFAWLVGFITPGAPGGVGIREALLSVLLANVISPEVITVAVIFNRIVTVAGDVFAYLVSTVLSRSENSER